MDRQITKTKKLLHTALVCVMCAFSNFAVGQLEPGKTYQKYHINPNAIASYGIDHGDKNPFDRTKIRIKTNSHYNIGSVRVGGEPVSRSLQGDLDGTWYFDFSPNWDGETMTIDIVENGVSKPIQVNQLVAHPEMRTFTGSTATNPTTSNAGSPITVSVRSNSRKTTGRESEFEPNTPTRLKYVYLDEFDVTPGVFNEPEYFADVVSFTNSSTLVTFSFIPTQAKFVKMCAQNRNDEWSLPVCIKINPVAVSNISITPKPVTLNVGETQTLTATIVPNNATDKTITWSSSNSNVASVSSNGVVTAKATGTATITATSNNGKTATCSVTVTTSSATTITLHVGTAGTMCSLLEQSYDKLKITDLTLTGTLNADDFLCMWEMSNEGKLSILDIGNTTLVRVNHSIYIGNNEIGDNGFNYWKELQKITLPKSVTIIGDGAFGDCPKLTTVVLPEKLTAIGDDVFSNCPLLSEVQCKNPTPPSIGNSTLDNLNNVTVIVPAGSENAYNRTPWANVRISTAITSVEETAFIVYPNPTTGQFTISGVETQCIASLPQTVEIYDYAGRFVGVEYFRPAQNNELTINISHLPTGIYFLQINGARVKIVKQ